MHEARGEVVRRFLRRVRTVRDADRGGDAEAGRPDRLEPRRRQRRRRTRDPRRSAAAAGRRAGAGQRTSLTPSASASACSRAGQARRPSPNGRPARSTRITFPSGSSRFVDGTGGSSPRISAAVASQACTSSATCCASASSSRGRQPVEQPLQRLVGARRVRSGLVRRGDRPHVIHDVAVDAGGRGQHRHRHVLPRGAAAAHDAATPRRNPRRGSLPRRLAPRRAARPGRARPGAPRSSRGGGRASRPRRTETPWRAATPSCRTGRAGPAAERDSRASAERYARDVSVSAETSRA